jgi:hypothetical protein
MRNWLTQQRTDLRIDLMYDACIRPLLADCAECRILRFPRRGTRLSILIVVVTLALPSSRPHPLAACGLIMNLRVIISAFGTAGLFACIWPTVKEPLLPAKAHG